MKPLEIEAREWCVKNGVDPDEMIKPLPGINAPAVVAWRLYGVPEMRRAMTPASRTSAMGGRG